MQYETLIDNYTPELQLIDALDMLKHYEPKAAEILDQWASESNTERIDGEPLQMGPTHSTFSQDIQLLSTDWEPQYKSQGDLISISSTYNDGGQEWEYPYPLHNKDLTQHDVYLSSDLHLTTKFD